MSFTAERLLAALEACLAAALEPAPRGLCLALSGGLDSTVLACALVKLRDADALRLPLRAVHVDHGLHPDSAAWSAACARLAGDLSLPLTCLRVDAGATAGESPEAAARAARYGALRGELASGEVLLTAHHADDQLETILLQWLRGGGLQSVAGMARIVSCGDSWHARPLLDFPREQLHAWAVVEGLAWQEDPSNLNPAFDRNYLRLRVLPAIRARWPAVARTAGRVAEFATDALALEREIAAADLVAVSAGVTVVVERLRQLPDSRQRAVLRAWLRAQDLPVPPARTLEALRRDMGAAAADRIPLVRWPGVQVRRYRGRLYAESTHDAALHAGEWQTATARTWALDAASGLELVADMGRGLSQARLPARLQVAARFDGAQFRPAGAAHRRPLRKWFQDRGILPWRRDTIPLLCHGDEILAIADISCAEGYAAAPDEPSWRVSWHGRPLLTEDEALAINWRGTPSFD